MYKFIFVRIINEKTFSGYLLLKGHKKCSLQNHAEPTLCKNFQLVKISRIIA